jgi:hypothetical protein
MSKYTYALIGLLMMSTLLVFPGCASGDSQDRTKPQAVEQTLNMAQVAQVTAAPTKPSWEVIKYDMIASVVRIRDCDYIRSRHEYTYSSSIGYQYIHAADCRNPNHKPGYTDYPEEWDELSPDKDHADTLLAYVNEETGVAHIKFTGKHR